MKKIFFIFHLLAFSVFIKGQPLTPLDTIKIVGEVDYAPYSFLNEKNEPEGLFVDLAKAILEEMHQPYKITLTNWDDAYLSIDTGETDLILSIMNTPFRRNTFLFTEPVVRHYFVIVSLNTKPIKELFQLENSILGLQRFSAAAQESQQKNYSQNIIWSETAYGTLELLEKKMCDAVIIEENIAFNYIEKHNSTNFYIHKMNKYSKGIPSCFGVKKDNIEVYKIITEGLLRIKKNDVYNDIYNRWLGIYSKSKENFILKYLTLISSSIFFILLIIIFFVFRKQRKLSNSLQEKNEILNLGLKTNQISIWLYNIKKESFIDFGAKQGILNAKAIKEAVKNKKEVYEKEISNAINKLKNGESNEILLEFDNNTIKKIHQTEHLLLKIKTINSLIGKPNILIGIVLITTDIEQLEKLKRQALQNQIKRKKAELERNNAIQKNKSKNNFLAQISHEIRTPLNAIVGFASLSIDTEDKKERQALAPIIEEHTNRLINLFDNLFDLAAIESGSIIINQTTFNIKKLLEDIKKEMKEKETSLIPLEINCEIKEPIIRSDKNRIKQIIDKLLNNAYKFTSEGSIKISCFNSNDGLQIEIKDTGIGIPEDKQKIIFERFEKADDFMHGAGLGLPIINSLIKLLGGKMRVTSKLGKGSTFSVWLPLS